MAFKSKKILTVGLVIVFGLVIFGGLARGVGAADPDPRISEIRNILTGSNLEQFNTFIGNGGTVDQFYDLQANGLTTRSVPTDATTLVQDMYLNGLIELSDELVDGAAVVQQLEGDPALMREYRQRLADYYNSGQLKPAEVTRVGGNTLLGNAGTAAKNALGIKANSLADILGLAVSYFLYFIAYGLGVILMIAIKVMLTIATYNGFLTQPAVQIGWTIVRDVCNNFFIVLMIAMAVGTALNRQDFQWRNMLPKVLLMAVLINFSKMFTGMMIDASQILMLTFAAPLATSTAYNIILASFGLPSFMQLSNIVGKMGDTDTARSGGLEKLDWWDIIAALLFAIIVTIAALVVIIVIAITLAYRIVMLWFLVILSPLWIFGKSFKMLEGYTNEWKSQITKYLVVGPAMMFFLYLSFMTLSTVSMTGKNSPESTNVLGGDAQLSEAEGGNKFKGGDITLSGGGDQNIALSNMASPNGMINVLIVVGLLWASLMMGQRFGGVAASWSGKGMGWLQKYTGANLAKSLPGRAGKAAKATAGFVGTAVDDKLGVRSRLYSGIYKAGGRFVPGLNTYLGGKVGTLEGGRAKRRQGKLDATAAASGMGKMTQTQLRSMANSMTATPDQKRAAFQTMMKNGWINDDDKDKNDNNVKLINSYRSSLPPELLNTFDNNLKKSNAALAFQSGIYSGGSDRAKIEEDIKMGRLKLDALMKNAEKGIMDTLRQFGGGTNNGAMEWLIKNSKDDKEFGTVMAGLSRTAKEAFAGKEKDANGSLIAGVDFNTFRSGLSRNTPEEIEKADKDQKKLDKMREAYMKSSKDFRTSNLFEANNTEEAAKKKNFVGANRSLIASEIEAKQLKDFIEDVGEILDPKQIEQIADRGPEWEKAMKDAFDGLGTIIDTGLTSGVVEEVEKAKKKMENAFIAGSKIEANTDERRNALTGILSGKNKGKVLDNLAADNIDSNFLRSAVSAQLSGTDYAKLDPVRVKGGFDRLAAQVEADASINDSEAAKIVEQALINGGKVDLVSGPAGDRRRRAYQTALKGAKRHEILKNISQDNIDDNFINNGGLNGLSAKEIGDLSNLSVDHKNNLDRNLKARHNTILANLTNASNVAAKDDARNSMTQMASSGTYVDLGANNEVRTQFTNASKSFSADVLKNINLTNTAGVMSATQVRILAENVSPKELVSFFNSKQNENVRDAIVTIIRRWRDDQLAGRPISAEQNQKVTALSRWL